ncbi:hypothetical protein [Fodinibius halophilus]|uniref:DUF4402 domain-containing protein n=1 Tax=Fodinibius halophilus TaxID=1736908 RepID=A0A6M1SV70_9BACT|nr:hypothetical protein [Fodinibius halophilus]NGP87828.1 hypothetical protein [Fodinibius halophilus]
MGNRITAISLILIFAITIGSRAQEIDFGDYGNYTLTVDELNNNDLEFGQVISGSGLHSIGINNAKVISITGVEYIDVIVDVTGANSLYLNGNPGNAGDSQKSIPFTLKAAYANNQGTPTIGQAKFITGITNNSFIKQFPILERQHQPPGPPPTPPTNAFDQAQVEETAYLYLYGDINVGNVDAGTYSSTIDITVNYD